MCIKYAHVNNLTHHEDWKWIDDYIKTDDTLTQMIHSYRLSTLGENRFDFGVEIPKTPKTAFALDIKNKDNLWKEATTKELDQVIHEFSSFQAAPRFSVSASHRRGTPHPLGPQFVL